MNNQVMNRVRISVFSFFVLTAGAQNLWGSDIDRVLSVLESIKQRQDSYNPVDVQYKVNRTYTRYRFASTRRIDPSDRRLFSTLPDATVFLRCEYSAKGDRLLLAVDGPSISADGVVSDSIRTTSTYDGTLFKNTGGDGKLIAISKKKPVLQDPLSTFNGEATLIGLLLNLKGGAKPDALAVNDNPGRVPSAALCLHTAFGKGDQESVMDIWVASEEKGYPVVRFERRLGGKLFHEYTDCEYKQVDGIWFPFKAVYRNYYHNKSVHQLASEERLEVERITCRADEIPDSQFIIPVTNDTELIDRDRKNLRIIGPDKVDKHILEAVADVQRERAGDRWYRWLYVLGSVLFLVGAFYLGVRMVLARRKGKKQAT